MIYREVKLKDLFDLCVDSAKTTGGIMLIVACASLFSYVCTKFGIADAASELLGSIAHNQFTFLLIVNVIFLIAGCFIDANSAMYIFIPVMLPVCKALGYDCLLYTSLVLSHKKKSAPKLGTDHIRPQPPCFFFETSTKMSSRFPRLFPVIGIAYVSTLSFRTCFKEETGWLRSNMVRP